MRNWLIFSFVLISNLLNAQLNENLTKIIDDRINAIPDSLGKENLKYYDNTSIVIFSRGDYDDIEERIEALELRIDKLIDENLFTKQDILINHHSNNSYLIHQNDTLMCSK